MMNTNWLKPEAIEAALASSHSVDKSEIMEILAKARELKGLSPAEASRLFNGNQELEEELFAAARDVKQTIYGKRMVLFAPLYVSSHCANECLYCAFRARNRELKRRTLNSSEIIREVEELIRQGHKRLLLVAGESHAACDFDSILNAISTVYSVRHGCGAIRRINVNIAPLDVEQFRRLAKSGIGTYQLFQESYHLPTYKNVHLAGPKADFPWRLEVMDRAMQAGINDVGIGALFGLYDWRFEVLALLQHAEHLESRFGAGPHTISVPRLEPARNSDLSSNVPHMVTDRDFRRLIAILRLAVPYTGIILSTRENAELRREAFALGVSQISAGSRTNPGAYQEVEDDEGQFSLGDHRSLDEVVRDIASHGYVPSFCTGCYRLGRTGADFMDLARPGEIRSHCDPNAVSSFTEYLEDYASGETRAAGEAAMEGLLQEMDEKTARNARVMRKKVQEGERDVYC